MSRVEVELGLCVGKLKSDHGVLQISTDRDLKHYGMPCAFVGSDQVFGSFVRIE